MNQKHFFRQSTKIMKKGLSKQIFRERNLSLTFASAVFDLLYLLLYPESVSAGAAGQRGLQ